MKTLLAFIWLGIQMVIATGAGIHYFSKGGWYWVLAAICYLIGAALYMQIDELLETD